VPNRQIADNDFSFEVKIGGYSRGNWALMMEVLHEWLNEHQDGDRDRVLIVERVLSALESHVVQGYDGSSVGRPYGANLGVLTDQEVEALRSVRQRAEQKEKERQGFAKEVEREMRKQRRKEKAGKVKPEKEQTPDPGVLCKS